MDDNKKKFDLVPLLDYIDPATLNYQEWVNVGMALHKEGYDVAVWDAWSRKDGDRYNEGECERKWNTFHEGYGNVTGATITKMAKENGWQKKSSKDYIAIDWSQPKMADPLVVVDKHWIEDSDIEMPGANWNPRQDFETYIRTLFNMDEYVGYVAESFTTKDGRLAPSKGKYMRTAGELLDRLKKTNNLNDELLLGKYDEAAGCWIRINPLDGKGVKNENVTDYRYTLVESDTMSIGKQKAILEEMQLPIACLVYSGGKSLHAIVRVDAESAETYKQRVDFIYSVMEKNGFKVDKANRNPARLSRLPGVMRNGQKQFLIGTNIGLATFDEWEDWITSVNDDLPDPVSLEDVWGNLPELAPPLIDGVLRQGHKMLIAGPSKAGKSYALIQLCISIAEGKPWMGFNCAQGRVLYVNLELDRASCFHRFEDVYRARQLPATGVRNIDIWNLRGSSVPMDKLAPKLIKRAVNKGYIAVVIDPIYKVITGDENSADQMANFCNQFDKICKELECAVIYCHHHSKGSQSGKRSMDRASGSGVFARDPDALLDLIQLEVLEEDTDIMNQKPEHFSNEGTAWRLEGTLREFKQFSPRNLWFDFPLHKVDESGWLEMAAPDDPQVMRGKKSGISRKKKSKDTKEKLMDAIGTHMAFNSHVPLTVGTLETVIGVSDKTIRRMLKDNELYEIKNSEILIKNNSLSN